MKRPRGGLKAVVGAVGLALVLPAASAPDRPASDSSDRPEDQPPSLVLLTLDTTRADHLGCYGSSSAETPALDALAARGTLYRRAVAPSPLTLPSHATLLTGLEPPVHGLRDNGTAVLDPSVATLATVLAARGWAAGAFVSSRVLDRRFGLAAGFDVYDDRMAAERLGEYGYPERDAAAVTSAAIAWLGGLDPRRPYFLWVHYYDPHAPYEPPEAWRTGSPGRDYAGEISYMDSEIGRLLAALPAAGPRPVVAAVADHGEALGEHGERRHGIFLYRASLEVPLILAGPGVPAGGVVGEVVAVRRLAATLLRLLGLGGEAAALGPSLPGLPALGDDPEPEPVYSETLMPANAYGWSPLRALTDQRWRLIVAPRPELYDLAADPGELRNLFGERRREAGRLARELAALERSFDARPTLVPPRDPDLAADLRSLGYLSGGRRQAAGRTDPKDGIAMLAELEAAKELIAAGQPARAAGILRDLVRRSPDNVPFLTRLGSAELARGDAEAAIAAYRRAVALHPDLELLHLNLARAYQQLGRAEEARAAFERALALDRRLAPAWLGLGELALRAGDGERERRLLLEAVAAGSASAAIHARLGQIEAAAGDLAAADGHLRVATGLAPELALAWLLWGENAEARGRVPEAVARYRTAAGLAPGDPAVLLRLGRLLLRTGAVAEGRRHLERAAGLAPRSAAGREARRLLEEP